VQRIHETAARPGGFVAHHYTRYLGDLPGGQVIRTVLQR
jgi:heme oxygenase